jgi:hypothetical protein
LLLSYPLLLGGCFTFPAGVFVLKGCHLLLWRQPLPVEEEPLPEKGAASSLEGNVIYDKGAAPVLKSAAACGEVSLAVRGNFCVCSRWFAAASS